MSVENYAQFACRVFINFVSLYCSSLLKVQNQETKIFHLYSCSQIRIRSLLLKVDSPIKRILKDY